MFRSFSHSESVNDEHDNEEAEGRVLEVVYSKLPDAERENQRDVDNANRQEILSRVQGLATNTAEAQGTELQVMSLASSGFAPSNAPANSTNPMHNNDVSNLNDFANVVRSSNPDANACCNRKCVLIGAGVTVGVAAVGTGLFFLIRYLTTAANKNNNVPEPNAAPCTNPQLAQQLTDQLRKWNSMPESDFWSAVRGWVTANPPPSLVMQNQVLLFAHCLADKNTPAVAAAANIPDLVTQLVNNWDANLSLDQLYLAASLLSLNGKELIRYEKLNVLAQAVSVIANKSLGLPPQLNDLETISLAHNAGDAAVPVSATLTVCDENNAPMSAATVQILDGAGIGETLGFQNTGGITGTYANGTLNLTGTDTLANYQTALRSVTYRNTDAVVAVTRKVQFQVTKQITSGTPSVTSSLSGNKVSRSINVTVNVTTPTLRGLETQALAYTEGASTAITAALTVLSPENLTAATVSITTGYQSGRDRLLFTDTNTIKGAFNASTGVLTLTGSDTPANYQAALQSVLFLNNNPDGAPPARTVTIQVSAGTTASNAVTRGITLTAVDDRPLITMGADDLSDLVFPAGGAANQFRNVVPNILITDEDSNNLKRAVIQITQNYQRGQDFLGFSNAGTPNIRGAYDQVSGTLTLTGDDTLTNYRTALRTITYKNTADPRVTTTRTVSITVSTTVAPDSSGNSDTVSRNIRFA